RVGRDGTPSESSPGTGWRSIRQWPLAGCSTIERARVRRGALGEAVRSLWPAARGGSRVNRVFLLSPAPCGGTPAPPAMREEARFDLAQQLRSATGAPLGEVFSFFSGLYFRGKLAYARAFAQPPAGLSGIYVITPTDGLRPADEPVDVERLRRFAAVDI